MDQVTVPRAVAQQALEALEAGPDVDPIFAGETEVALRAALEQPEQKDVPAFLRAAFERHAESLGYSVAPDTRAGREGGYWSSHTHLMWETWQAALEQPEQEPVAWPKGRDLFLRDDMGKGQLRVMFDGDNDVIVAIWPHDKPSASVEFCNGFNGGGKSLETRKALIALMCAMERDGAHARPHALEQPEQEPAKRATGWVAPKDHYTTPVFFNPYTGDPRDVRDVRSDPQGILIVPPGAAWLTAKG
jgi:hypothetical protein